jgi:subtilisin family serine protease
MPPKRRPRTASRRKVAPLPTTPTAARSRVAAGARTSVVGGLALAPVVDAWHFAALGIGALHADGVRGAGIRIGVVDTGVLPSHAALVGRSLLVRDRRGSAFDGEDVVGHGTEMIGLLIGVPAGIAPGSTVISMKAFSSTNRAEASQVATGIELLLDEGIDVLSLSVGSPEADQSLTAAITRAVDTGVVVVAAADDRDSTDPQFPAALTPVIAVTAVDRQGAPMFAIRPDWVDIGAPGDELTTSTLNGMGTSSGTSSATAVCAGVCALLLGTAPRDRRPALGRQLLAILSASGPRAGSSSDPNAIRLLDPGWARAAVQRWLET